MSFAALVLAVAGCSSADSEDGDVSTGNTQEQPSPEPTVTEVPTSPPADLGPCDIDSGYDGDDLCIPPPETAELGFQLHVGPSDYDDPEEVDLFIQPAGAETVECWHISTPNEEGIYNQQRQIRMRPGTHHLILKHTDEALPDGWGSCPGGLSGSWGGAQKAITDIGYVDIAPEDAGYASRIEAHQRTAAELHYVNTTEEPILREFWANFYTFDESQFVASLNGIALIGGLEMSIPAGTAQTLHYDCENTVQDRRVVAVNGHVHAHTSRFSTWLVNDAGRELIYEMYDWAEPASVRFNTVADNPIPDPATGLPGGHTGLLFLSAGDRLEWECEVNNTLDTTITFANEAYTAEMCILFGSTVEDTWQCLGQRTY